MTRRSVTLVEDAIATPIARSTKSRSAPATPCTHTLSATDVEALSLAAGDVETFHLDLSPGQCADGASAPGAAAIALIAGILNRRLPGPGSAIVGTRLHLWRPAASPATRSPPPSRRARSMRDGRVIEFDCRATHAARREAGRRRGDRRGAAAADRVHRYRHAARSSCAATTAWRACSQRCEAFAPVLCAVVHPCDRDSLPGAIEAARRGLIVPILVGPEAKIRAAARRRASTSRRTASWPTPHSHAAAGRAVAMARAGEVEALMKGSLHTDELMAAVVPRGHGLAHRAPHSHVFVMDVPAYPRPAAHHRRRDQHRADLEAKADICQNAIDLAHVLGVAAPRVAILSAVETVNPKMRVDAATPPRCARWPIAARSPAASSTGRSRSTTRSREQAARTKGIASPVAGRGRHPARARPRSGQHAGEAAHLSRRRRQRGHRARRARADRAHVARRQRARRASHRPRC